MISRLKPGVLLIDENFYSMNIPPFVIGGLGGFHGGIAVVNIKIQMAIQDTLIRLGVSLMHELGHAKQYTENPVGFEKKAQGSDGSGEI